MKKKGLIITIIITLVLAILILLIIKSKFWVSEEDILNDLSYKRQIMLKDMFYEFYYPEGKENYTKEQVAKMIDEMEKKDNTWESRYNNYIALLENKADIISDDAKKLYPDTYNLRTKTEKDGYYICTSLTRRSYKECNDIVMPFSKVECIEGYYLLKALESNDPTICKDAGGHKINNWCVAYITSDSEICKDKEMENEVFRTICYALAEKNFSLCEGIEHVTEFSYYVILGVAQNDPSLCDKNSDPGDGEYCRAVVSKDKDYCKEEDYS